METIKTQYPREFLLQLQNDPLSNVWPENLSKEYMKGGQMGKEEKTDLRKKPTTGCKENNWRSGTISNTGSPRAARLGENKERRLGNVVNNKVIPGSPRLGINNKVIPASPRLGINNKLMPGNQGINTKVIAGSPRLGIKNKLIPGSPRVGRQGDDASVLGSPGVKRGRVKKSPAMLARDAKRREAYLVTKKLQENIPVQLDEEKIDDEKETEISSFADVKIMVTDTTEDCEKMAENVDVIVAKKTDLAMFEKIPEEQETTNQNDVEERKSVNSSDTEFEEVDFSVRQKKRRFYSESCGRRERRMSEGEKVGLWLYQKMAIFPLQAWRKVSRTVGELTSRARLQDIYIPQEW